MTTYLCSELERFLNLFLSLFLAEFKFTAQKWMATKIQKRPPVFAAKTLPIPQKHLRTYKHVNENHQY
jgi:hypothetical protein